MSCPSALPPPGRRLQHQVHQHRADWPAGDRCSHSNCDCDQLGSIEEKAVRHHQPRHCRGKTPQQQGMPTGVTESKAVSNDYFTNRLARRLIGLENVVFLGFFICPENALGSPMMSWRVLLEEGRAVN